MKNKRRKIITICLIALFSVCFIATSIILYYNGFLIEIRKSCENIVGGSCIFVYLYVFTFRICGLIDDKNKKKRSKKKRRFSKFFYSRYDTVILLSVTVLGCNACISLLLVELINLPLHIALIVIAGLAIFCLVSFLIVYIIIKLIRRKKYKHITTVYQGIKIESFVKITDKHRANQIERTLYFLIDQNEYFETFALYYEPGDKHSILFNIMSLVNYAKYKKEDIKNSNDIVKITKEYKGLTISAVYDKYKRKMKIIVNDKIIKEC